MRTRVKVHVHRNYVQTLVRFIERPCSYVEFGVGSLRGPINVLNSTNLRADLETSVSYGVDERFSEFPENAYFEMVYEYETSASVQGAASSKDVLLSTFALRIRSTAYRTLPTLLKIASRRRYALK